MASDELFVPADLSSEAAARVAADATKADLIRTLNTQTNDYTLVAGDAGKVVEMNKATANTLTVPPNSSVAFAVGTYVDVIQIGAGVTTITAGGGVTIRSPGGLALVQYGSARLTKRATDEWELTALSGASATRVRKSTDQILTNSNTVLQDVTGMSFPIAANEVKRFRIVLGLSAASDAPDAQVALTFPAGATMLGLVDGPSTATTTVTSISRRNVVIVANGTSVNTGVTSAGVTITTIEGSIVNGATAGTVQLQAAQLVSTAAADVTVKAGSTLVAETVPF